MRWLLTEEPSEGSTPSVSEGGDFGADYCLAIQFDAEFNAGDSAHFHGCHSILCRNPEDSGKVFGSNRYDGARAALAEERGLVGLFRGERNFCREAVACKARFGQRYGEAAVAYVMRGLQFAFACNPDKQPDQPLF